MFKQSLATIVLLLAASAFAVTDVNQANVADLDAIKGIGPTLSGKILDERKKGNFKDWGDLMARVKGIRAATAAKLSEQGLTVDGAPFQSGATK